MQRQDKLILHFLKQAFEHIPNDTKEKGKQIQFASFLTILIMLCLFLTGSEAVKVTLRKKTGKGELSFIRLFLTFLFLLIIGILFITIKGLSSILKTQWSAETNDQTFFIGGLFYICFAIFMVVMGLINKIKKQDRALPDMYPGRCRLFIKAENKSGIRRSAIRNLLHPFIFFTGGAILFYIHPLLGLPLIACSISYWIVFIVEYTLGFESERLKAIELFDGTSQDIVKFSNNNHQDRPKNISSIEAKWK
jgi:hypothetical protein